MHALRFLCRHPSRHKYVIGTFTSWNGSADKSLNLLSLELNIASLLAMVNE